MKNMGQNKSIKLYDDISWQEYFGLVYIIKETANKIYTLSDEAVSFWKILQENSTIGDALLSAYRAFKEYDEKSVKEEFENLLLQLKDYKIITEE